MTLHNQSIFGKKQNKHVPTFIGVFALMFAVSCLIFPATLSESKLNEIVSENYPRANTGNLRGSSYGEDFVLRQVGAMNRADLSAFESDAYREEAYMKRLFLACVGALMVTRAIWGDPKKNLSPRGDWKDQAGLS